MTVDYQSTPLIRRRTYQATKFLSAVDNTSPDDHIQGMTNGTVIRNYSRDFLLQVQSVVCHKKPQIPLAVIHTLRQNNICSVPRTHRGVSAGISKQRPIKPWITTPGLPGPLHNRNFIKKDNLKSQVTKTVRTPLKSSKSGLCIGLLNAQSVRNKIDIVRDTVIEHDIDIFALTETWLTSAAKDEIFIKELQLAGFELFSVPRRGNTGYGGVALLYKKNLVVESKANLQNKSFEHCEILFRNASTHLKVTVVYRPPPSTKNKLTNGLFFEEFSTYLHDQIAGTDQYLLLGDLNFHLEDKKDCNSKRLSDLLDELNFKQHVSKGTHKSGHTLDVVVSRDNDLVQNLTVGDLLTDHNLLLCSVHQPKPKPLRISVPVRKLRKLNVSSFKEDIKQSDLGTDLEGNISSLTDQYNHVLSSLLDKHAPAKTKLVTVRPSHPWYSDELYAAKRERRRCERVWRRTGLTIHYQLLRAATTEYSNKLSLAKQQYYNNLIADASTDSKSLSNIIKDILQQKSDIKLPKHNSEVELANRFGKFFRQSQ